MIVKGIAIKPLRPGHSSNCYELRCQWIFVVSKWSVNLPDCPLIIWSEHKVLRGTETHPVLFFPIDFEDLEMRSCFWPEEQLVVADRVSRKLFHVNDLQLPKQIIPTTYFLIWTFSIPRSFFSLGSPCPPQFYLSKSKCLSKRGKPSRWTLDLNRSNSRKSDRLCPTYFFDVIPVKNSLSPHKTKLIIKSYKSPKLDIQA